MFSYHLPVISTVSRLRQKDCELGLHRKTLSVSSLRQGRGRGSIPGGQDGKGILAYVINIILAGKGPH